MNKSMLTVHAAFAAVVAGALLASNASAATIHVPEDFPTIQQAIEAASNGDEIIVAPGTYFENINLLGKAIHLRSSGGPEETTIDATGLNTSVVACFNGEGADTIIEGFTFTGGNTSQGGGMLNFFSSPTVINCIFTGNAATFGGGMSNDAGSSPTMTDCRFENNTAASSGGGVDNFSFSFPTFNNCTFAGNSAGSGGAIFNSFFTSCSSHITGTTFCENSPDDIVGSWHDQGGNEFLDECPPDDIVGDLDGNGVVDVFDLLILLAAWGDCGDPSDCPADLDGNGVVDVFDLLILLANWG